MNKEFVYINDDVVAVSNENGNLTIRKAENRMHDVLVAEDKLDSLNTTINWSRNGIRIEKVSIDLINKWYKIMGGLSVAVVIAAPITLGLAGLGLIAGWGVMAGAACAYGTHVKKDSIKRIKGHKNEIKRAKELQNQIIDDLEFGQELAKESNLPHEKIGEVVLIDNVKAFEDQERTLRTAFNRGYKQKPKTLVKTRQSSTRNTIKK